MQYEYHLDYPWLVYDILLVSLSWDSMGGFSVVIKVLCKHNQPIELRSKERNIAL